MSDTLRIHLRSLQSLDPDRRKTAILGLADEQSIEALQALQKTAEEDTNLELRFLAKKALAKLQQSMAGPPPTEATAAAAPQDPFVDGDEHAKIQAIKRAATQKCQATVDRLLDLLERETNTRVRGTALLALGLVGGTENVPIFSRFLADTDPNVRLNCVKALTYLDASLAYPLFVVALNDQTPQVASRAYGFLRKLGKGNIMSLLTTMAQSRHRWMRKAVAKACGRLNTPEVIPILRELAAREGGDIRDHAVRSLKTLTELGNQHAHDVLAKMQDVAMQMLQAAPAAKRDDEAASNPVGLPSPELSVRRRPADGPLLATRSAGFIIPAGQKDLPLNAEGPGERMNALQDIVDEGDPARIPEVLTRLRIEKNLKVKAALLAALGHLGGEEEVDHIKLYLEHPDARIRATAVENIGTLAPPTMVSLLKGFLDDEDNRTAANAIVALGDCPDVDIGPALARLVTSTKVNHRKSAIFAILHLEDPDATAHLPALSSDENPEVAERASEVLALLAAKGVTPPTHEPSAVLSPATADAPAGDAPSSAARPPRERRKPPLPKQSTLKKSQLPSRVDLDRADYMQHTETVPADLLTACYFDYAVASTLAVFLFGSIYLAAIDGIRFGLLLAIALGIPLAYVATALSLQAGKEWARQFTLYTATALPLPGLGPTTKQTLAAEGTLDFFDSDPTNPGVVGRGIAATTVGLLIVFVFLLVL